MAQKPRLPERRDVTGQVPDLPLPPAQFPDCITLVPEAVCAGSPRCQAPVVAVSVPLGLVVQPSAVSKPSEKTVVPPPPPPNNECSSRFGEPLPGLDTTPVVALFTIAWPTAAALWLPNWDR